MSANEFNRLFPWEKFKLNRPWTVDLQGASLKSSLSPFNAYMFCCSLLETVEDVEPLNTCFDTDAQYYINDIWRFADTVGERIFYVIKQKGKEDPKKLSFEQSRLDELRVIPIIDLVNYSDAKKEILVNDDNIKSFNPHMVILKQLFTKSTRFIHEKEIRFVWLLALGDYKEGRQELISCTDPYLHLGVDAYARSLSSDPFALEPSQICNRSGEPLIN